MKTKRITSFILLAAMILSLAAGCASGDTQPTAPSVNAESSTPAPASSDNAVAAPSAPDPFSPYEKPLTIKIAKAIESTNTFPAGQDATNNNYTKFLKDELNIDIEFDWVAQDGEAFDQKIGLAISSDSLPDMVVVKKAPQFSAMVKNDQCRDLSQVINDYASPAMKMILDSTGGIAIDMVTFGGEVLALPNVAAGSDDYHNMWIRKDWLDNVGMAPPATLDEVEAVLNAFVNNDPDKNGKKDTIGLAGPDKGSNLFAHFMEPSSNHFGFDPVSQAFKAYPGFWLNQGGEAVYGSITPETKQALAKLRDWYSKGLIDPEAGIRDNKVETITNGTCGFFFGVWWAGYWPLPDAFASDPTASWISYPGPFAEDGKWYPHLGSPTREYGIVNKNFANPEALVKINNLLLRDEEKLDTAAVQIGDFPLRLVFAPSDECDYTAAAVMDLLTGKKTEDQIETLGYKLLKNDLKLARETKLEPFDNYDIQYWNQSSENFNRLYSILVGCDPMLKTPYTGVRSITYAQTDSMERVWANLAAKEKEVFLGIITGNRPLDDFDTFVLEWKSQGGDDVTKEVKELIK